MIFITVGTHEQQFDRLIKTIDKLKQKKIINEEIFVQTGFSNYKPKYCNYKKFISYEEVNKKIKEARIVITHGGPSSFIPVLQNKKVPIVVPRNSSFQEHINNHQIDFVKKLESFKANIIPIYNIKDLEKSILNYEKIIKGMKNYNLNNNKKFCKELKNIVEEMFS